MRGGHLQLVVKDAPSSRTMARDRTIVRVRSRAQERYRVVCTTRHQQTSRYVTVSDTCTVLPPIGKHVTTISFPQKMDRQQIASPNMGQIHIQEQTYVQAPSYVQTQNYSTSPLATSPIYARTSPNGSGYVAPQMVQQLHKKGSLRNGDILKRSRVQNTYELSQDILDKQIELLERKYGGDRARSAALTIQRAFRRYTLLKKFAAITAMAKAEKRISRRLPANSDGNGNGNGNGEDRIASEGEPSHSQFESEYSRQFNNGHHDSHLGVRAVPMRSMSLRERRNVDNGPMPRSQSGTPTMCWENYSLHAQQPQQQQLQQQQQQQQLQQQQFHHHHHHHHYASLESKTYESHAMNLLQQQQLHHVHQQQQSSSSSSSSSSSTGQNTERCCAVASSTPTTTISTTPSNSNNNGYARSRSSLSNSRKVPPEVPKRTSSISSRSLESRSHRSNGGLTKTTENGSLSSVQSSGSDSSISADRIQCDYPSMWKNKGGLQSGHLPPEYAEPTLETSLGNISSSSANNSYVLERAEPITITPGGGCKISETVRKRQYRVGLNLFNKKPERGITYLMRKGFLENTPQGVARFLISRKGLSKQMIGEYLGNLQSPFSMAVLECFAMELDLSGMQVDVALRKFQQYYRMPGEAQKIERLMEVFSQRYCQCNVDIVARLRSPDTIFVLAFAIIMLNTDLHTPNIKPERRMKLEDFIKNLRGIDDCHDIDSDMLTGIYDRVKANEFKPGTDHVSQVMKVQATIVGKKPNMALPHRRLVCYCRLYEIPDITKKERPGVHQREVFLFNDLLVITKILSKKKSSVTYTFRNSFPLCGMNVQLFEVPHYPFGIRLSQRVDNKVLITFNARNEHDRVKFAEDLKESVFEMDEMENLRIEAELERQKSSRGNRSGTENRDSGVADVEVCPCHTQNQQNEEDSEDVVHETQIKRSALSNSLLDIHEQFTGEKAQRRGSVGSLDSGMSISFQSTSASSCSRSDKGLYKGKPIHYPHSFLGSLFSKKQHPGGVAGGVAKSTEV